MIKSAIVERGGFPARNDRHLKERWEETLGGNVWEETFGRKRLGGNVGRKRLGGNVWEENLATKQRWDILCNTL
jgi:hypothetical protein